MTDLCRVKATIYLRHDFGPGWICRRCGARLNLKQLIRNTEP